MTSKIIELSQNTAQVVNANGDYNVALPYNSDLVLTAGDTLVMKSAFIDTEAQSDQKIVIANDIELTMQFYYYYMYSRADGLIAIATTTIPTIDCKPWLLCINDSVNPNLYNMTSIRNTIQHFSHMDNPTTGHIIVDYFDAANNKHRDTFQTPETMIRDGANDYSITTCNITYDKSKPILFEVYPQTQAGQYVSSVNTEAQISTGAWTPVIGTKKMTVRKGNYSPTQLSVEMNRNLQVGADMSNNVNQYATESPFIIVPVAAPREYGLVNAAGTEIMVLDGTLLLGASQIEIEYMADTFQFSFNFLHMPYFTTPVAVGSGGSGVAETAVGYLKEGANYLSINKNSGIVFTNLTAIENGKNANTFWTETLGFDITTSGLIVSTTQANITYGTPTQVPRLNQELLDGKNITGGFFPISAQLNRTAVDWFNAAISAGVQPSTFLSTSTDTFNIVGSQATISGQQFAYGYFLVEVNGNFNTDFYSVDSTPNIMAIISRYYELNSFTSGTSDDSLVYTHVGDPVTLSSFAIRVLTPSRKLADNLGKNTSIFLELTQVAAAQK